MLWFFLLIAITVILSPFVLLAVSFSRINRQEKEIWRQQVNIEELKKQIKDLREVMQENHAETPNTPLSEHSLLDVSNDAIEQEVRALPMAADVSVEPKVRVKPEAADRPVIADKPITEPPPPAVEKPLRPTEPFDIKRVFPFINNENWVGISLFNRVGILLVIIGTIAIAAFEGFHPMLRTSILFALAFGVTGMGEYMNRKKPTIFSIGLSAAGVALTYVAIAASFFALGTLGMYAALIACILATAMGIFLATRYNAQVIGCFALVGGYLPIFSLNFDDQPVIIGIMVYFTLLTLFSLTLAFTRKWSVMNILGYALTVAGILYLGWQAEPVAAFVYVCIQFMLYTALPLISAYRAKQRFELLDIGLIASNTFISSLVILLIANRLDINNIHAYVCLALVAVYAGTAYWIRRTSSQNELQTLFVLVSIGFAVLFVPFFYDAQWFVVAWLAIAVILLFYGILANKKLAESTGLIVFVLSITTRLIGDAVVLYEQQTDWQFTLDYGMLTLGGLFVLGCYIFKGRQFGEYEHLIKLVVLANAWIFLLYILYQYIPDTIDYSVVFLAWAVVSFALSYLYRKFKLWAATGTRVLAYIIHFAGLCFIWIGNFMTIGNFHQNIQLIAGLFIAIIGFMLMMYFYLTSRKNADEASGESDALGICKNINIVNIWIALLWCSWFIMADFIMIDYAVIYMLWTVITFAYSYLCYKAKLWASTGTRILAYIIHFAGMIFVWIGSLVALGNSYQNIQLAFNFMIASAGFALAIYYFISKRKIQHESELSHPPIETPVEQQNKQLPMVLPISLNKSGLVGIYKNMNIVNIWLALLWCVGFILQDFGFAGTQMVLIAITFAFGLALARIWQVTDRGVKFIFLGMHVIGIIWLWVFNSFEYSDLVLLVMLNGAVQLAALYVMHDSINRIHAFALLCPFKIIILSSYFLLAVTQTMMVQADVSFNSAIISIIYAVAAFAWIVAGFLIKNKPVRKAGLFLSMASVAKLLIVDTWELSIEMRIVSYLSLGLLLIFISFIYQKLSKITAE